MVLALFNSCQEEQGKSEDIAIPTFTKNTSELVSGEAAEWVDCIAYGNVVMGSAVGVVGEKPDEYKYYEQLVRSASQEDLLKLTEHENVAVRTYAFSGMVASSHPKTFSTFKKLWQDTTQVSNMFGCSFGFGPANHLVYDELQAGSTVKTGYQLLQAEQKTLDSLLLFSDWNHSSPSPGDLSNLHPFPEHYEKVKSIATEFKDERAIIALAGWQKKRDIPLIKEMLKGTGISTYYGRSLYAVCRFPDEAFLPDLIRIQNSFLENPGRDGLRELYLAIFHYSPKTIGEFIDRIHTKIPTEQEWKTTRHKSAIWLATQLNKNPQKKVFAPQYELDEWDEYILDYYKNLRILEDFN